MKAERPIVTSGKCPECGIQAYVAVPGVHRRVICPQCETIYLRLTGCEAFRRAAEEERRMNLEGRKT